MAHDVQCTHCHVLMTSWVSAQSGVRYWQCPFCARTHSSLYEEVFARGAGARRVELAPPPASAPAALPQASAEEIAWSALKARAARWFARLEREERPAPARPAVRPVARIATVKSPSVGLPALARRPG